MSRERPFIASTHRFRRLGQAGLAWAGRFLLWGGLVAIHLPLLAGALATTLSHGEGWASTLLLAGSILLFVLKLVDVPVLRLPRDWRARLAIFAVVALLHSDALGLAGRVELDLHNVAIPATLFLSFVVVTRCRRDRKPDVARPAATVAARAALQSVRSFRARLLADCWRPPTDLRRTVPVPVFRAPPEHSSPS
jgi:hypothetical protein